jgi:hypothetical protein
VATDTRNGEERRIKHALIAVMRPQRPYHEVTMGELLTWASSQPDEVLRYGRNIGPKRLAAIRSMAGVPHCPTCGHEL